VRPVASRRDSRLLANASDPSAWGRKGRAARAEVRTRATDVLYHIEQVVVRSDDYLLALAASESAVIVSGDDNLLSLRGFAPVYSPPGFLELFPLFPRAAAATRRDERRMDRTD
jgi:hypothetical protein